MNKRYITVNKLDLDFFKFIHKREPKNEKEFYVFQKKLDKRDQQYKESIVSEDDFSDFYTATKGRKNPFTATQNEYDGWDNED